MRMQLDSGPRTMLLTASLGGGVPVGAELARCAAVIVHIILTVSLVASSTTTLGEKQFHTRLSPEAATIQKYGKIHDS
ncbi:Hypothetical predicted protein [Octopus vulgaris]|uniref:Uncharacterized protein n=1 Tax=Octopus vulgaris TaxID=6645 RepID=A0AA36ARA4_OCTVU|nr:Hypothetical predicted protein [Octopus vulgaris]